MEQKQKSRVFFEEDRERLWDMIKEAISQNMNKEQLISYIGLTPVEFRNIRCNISLNRKAILNEHFSKFQSQIKRRATSVNSKVDKLNYNDILEDVKLNKLSRESLCRKYNISGTTYDKYIRTLPPAERIELRKALAKNITSDRRHVKLPPVHFKKHSGFVMKETSSSTSLPIGKLK